MVHIFRFAYLDPGTGSMIIQSLIGIVAGVALFGRKAIHAIKARIKGEKPESSTKTEAKTSK